MRLIPIVLGLLSIFSTAHARKITYIAHRGEAMDAPEGSLPSYKLAMDRHLSGVKLDVRYSKDKVIVMSHDVTLQRMTGTDLKISETTYADMKEKATYKTVDGYAKEKIVTLDEALAVVKNCPLLFIDFKFFSDEIAKDVFARLEKFCIPRSHVIVANFNYKALERIKELFPDVRTVAHISYKKKEDGTYSIFGKDYKDKADLAKAIVEFKNKIDLFGVNICAIPEIADKEFISTLQKNGLWVSIWFVNEPEQALYYSTNGADAFVTDCGGRMREVVEGK